MLYKCPVCCKQFKKKFNFERHIQRKISNEPKILNQRDNKTSELIKLGSVKTTDPISQESVERTFPISQKSVCDIVQNNYETLNFTNSKTNGYKCLICNKIYKHAQSLFNHKKKHLNYEEEVKKIDVNNKKDEDIILLQQKLETAEKKIETMEMNQNILTAKKKSSKNKTINNVIINGPINNEIINGPINNGIVNNEIINGHINNGIVNNIKIDRNETF